MGEENKKKPSSFSPDKGSKTVVFLYTIERIKISYFFLHLQYICGLEFGPFGGLSYRRGFNSFSKVEDFPHAEYIMRNVGLDDSQAGIKIARRNIDNLRYADDTTNGRK